MKSLNQLLSSQLKRQIEQFHAVFDEILVTFLPPPPKMRNTLADSLLPTIKECALG